MDYFGNKYDLLPGDDKRRKMAGENDFIESWKGYMSSEDEVLKNQKDIAQIVPERNFANLNWLYGVTLLICLVLGGRMWQLQIVKGAESLERAEGNMIHVKTNYAPRGVIYDRNGQILAGNKSRYDLKVIPAMLPDDNNQRLDNYNEIAKILGTESSQIRDDTEKDGLQVWDEVVLQENLDREAALVFKTHSFPGFFIENVSMRDYVCDEQCSHFLGYTGKVSEDELASSKNYQPIDQVGRSGLESFYEDELRGENGAEYRVVDATGQVINVLTPRESAAGYNVVTTIDFDLQQLAYQELMQELERSEVTGGAVVVSDPASGEIITLASAPSFSSNQMIGGLSADEYEQLLNNEKLPLFNRAISGEYPPGSTFKIVTATGILEEGLADRYDTVNDEGVLRIQNIYDPDIVYLFYSWDRSGLGVVDVVGALKKSSDIYFFVFGGGYEDTEGLGIDRLNNYAEKFMLSNTLGIDLSGERAGFIPTPEWKLNVIGEEWYLGDDYNAAIGQGDILATPLQVNAYTAAIANGGAIYRPHLLQKIVDSQGSEIMIFQPTKAKDNIMSEETLNIIREGMRAVVTDGTAKLLNEAVVPVAGKTGTAQYANNEKEHAWFTCYAPYDNPQIAVTVLVEGGGEGSSAAAPIALNLINQYFSEE